MASDNATRPRGRPATGRDPVTAVRLSEELLRQIDLWRAEQPDWPSRSAAIRQLIEAGLQPAPATPRLRAVGPEDEDRRVKPNELGANDD